MNPEAPIPAPIESGPARKPTLKERLMGVWNKFYSNKRIFWLITSLFSLIILITIAGTIFKLTKNGQSVTSPLPTTTAASAPGAEEQKKEPLDLAKEELQKLETQIKDLDIKQQRLTPPIINFKVDF